MGGQRPRRASALYVARPALNAVLDQLEERRALRRGARGRGGRRRGRGRLRDGEVVDLGRAVLEGEDRLGAAVVVRAEVVEHVVVVEEERHHLRPVARALFLVEQELLVGAVGGHAGVQNLGPAPRCVQAGLEDLGDHLVERDRVALHERVPQEQHAERAGCGEVAAGAVAEPQVVDGDGNLVFPPLEGGLGPRLVAPAQQGIVDLVGAEFVPFLAARAPGTGIPEHDFQQSQGQRHRRGGEEKIA